MPACLEALFSLHRKRWQSAGQREASSQPPGAVLSRHGGLLLARGLLEFWLLDLNGRPAAAQFGFRFGNTVSQLQEGFDREYSTDSVGYVLRARAIKDLIAQGVRSYDFLGGQPGYKEKWGAQVEHYLDSDLPCRSALEQLIYRCNTMRNGASRGCGHTFTGRVGNAAQYKCRHSTNWK